MNEMQVFKYEDNEVRTVERNGEVWWVLADVCRALGLERTDSVARRLDPDEKGTHLVSTPGGPQEMTIINESGLYMVIFRSDKPEAKAFKRWVTHEVLPSIRRTGRYELGGQTAPMALQGTGAAPLPLSAQSLWFTLLWLEKTQGGRGEVSASNDRLMALMGVSGHHTLAVARDTLVKAGYIAHTPGVKARPGVYKLLPQRV